MLRLVVVMYKMKTWKQKFLVMIYIFLLQHSDMYRGKGHLAYNMRPLHGDSSSSSFPPRRCWSGLYNNPYNAWGTWMPRQFSYNATDRWLSKPLDRSGLQLLSINL